MPEALVNAPYGGIGSVNSSWSDNPAWFTTGSGFPGTGASNGSVAGAFLQVNVSIDALSNVTVPGLGQDTPCGDTFQVELPMVVSGGTYTGGIFDYPWEPQFGPGALSDRLEPRMVNLTTYPGDASPFFSNGFSAPNMGNISTCGLPTQQFHAESYFLTVWIQFTLGGLVHLQPLDLPYNQSFNYHFPGGFGTWAVDNLSTLGGPGGGWAFDYLGPCL
jgi:hypothetical protein